MKRLPLLLLAILLFVACQNNNELSHDNELLPLEVEFEPQEHIEVGETLELKAIVTYEDEPVEDVDEVVFEVWERNDRDHGEMIEGIHEGNGVYVAHVTFDDDGIFEMYAHTTARDLHTMPKREVVVGEGGDYADEEESPFHTEGFEVHFMEPEAPSINENMDITVHVTLSEEPFTDLEVRYEIWQDGSEQHDWIDANERNDGEYIATISYEESGLYHIVVHIEDGKDLHEHAEYTITIDEQ